MWVKERSNLFLINSNKVTLDSNLPAMVTRIANEEGAMSSSEGERKYLREKDQITIAMHCGTEWMDQEI